MSDAGGGGGGTATPDQLRRIQRLELGLLHEFARRCATEDLRWCVIGGTLLGAARHQGFIPWDDDIDIGMPRPDYERFERLCRTATDPRYAWQAPSTEPAYPFMFGKLIRADSEVIEPAVADLPIRHAVYIDVFPLDGAPASPYLGRIHGLAFKAAVTALGARIHRTGGRRLAAYAFRLVPRWASLALVALLARLAPYDRSPRAVNASGAWGYARECQPKDRFEPFGTLPFEDMEVRTPGRWDEYLRGIYGDWTRLPPEEKRVPRHALTVITLPDEDATV